MRKLVEKTALVPEGIIIPEEATDVSIEKKWRVGDVGESSYYVYTATYMVHIDLEDNLTKICTEIRNKESELIHLKKQVKDETWIRRKNLPFILRWMV